MSSINPDWEAIRIEYITDSSATYRGLAEKYQVSFSALYKRAKREKWVESRKQSSDRRVTKAIKSWERVQEKRLARVRNLSDKLLKKLEEAIEELDVAQVRKVTKTKEIEYNDDSAVGKPTKETVVETEEIEEVASCVDRNGLRSIAAALLSIKEVQMLKSEVDREAIKLKLRILEGQAGGDEDGARGQTGVVLLPDIIMPAPPVEAEDLSEVTYDEL